ncbi:MAG: signal recognition particle-docking protein FtsY [Candidatus Paracaedimonas acanthamoebae]|uniref:Signal recognition particle receptor FtsY n=1 Tax=Candidatus Paracaedimonas acanthamoebae TaxID=244581 RepID=A0A8J7TTK8_9PROT|nr:signal recognition particle-docking protein FtsY [Candidatus Paracaedimonas acanthamoebae]
MAEEISTKGWLSKLKEGLKRTSTKITGGLEAILVKKKLDKDMLEEIEDLLLSTDLGVTTTKKLINNLEKNRFNQEITSDEIKNFLAEEISKSLSPFSSPLLLDETSFPHVVLVVGINGSGKTTTIGKLAHFWKNQGKKVRLVAGDTFRAAAVEQLNIWGNRLEIPVETSKNNGDPAGLAHEALQKSIQEKDDLLMIDTAGRLHNKEDLMAELAKIIRVLKKLVPEAPHSVILVLDATIGQNALAQAETFKKIAGITGLIVTKLDGTAKGGVLVALAEKFQLPIHAIGVGEDVEDLKPFEPQAFASSLVGL